MAEMKSTTYEDEFWVHLIKEFTANNIGTK